MKLHCRICGVRIRFVFGRWVHSIQNWQSPLSEEPFGHLAERDPEEGLGLPIREHRC